ncbi:phosphatase PAP2 family protein [Taylorella equigenitalis]|uniref:phosphatase PAP2 family protein n=1 Tax=Taylorella equigenitalis TaxID=29575 RepID=UPI00237DE5DC|nr:phosphatase PAP2 family protein [Taylorella equigenitalis]WDU52408.1 phosphatase PAP2 family protein [Taylorella equigenitalis]
MKFPLPETSALELRFFFWLLSLNQIKYVTKTSRLISKLGDGQFYVISGVLFLILGGDHGVQMFLIGCIAYSIELPLYWFIKNSIKRDRPFRTYEHVSAVVIPKDTFSFPSGHTAAAFVFATMVSIYFPPFTFPVYTLACLIGLSRVLLGVHYPTDIVAGALLGKLSAWIALVVAQ